MNPTTEPKPTAADKDDMESSDYFFIPAFNDPNASEQLLGPMPSVVKPSVVKPSVVKPSVPEPSEVSKQPKGRAENSCRSGRGNESMHERLVASSTTVPSGTDFPLGPKAPPGMPAYLASLWCFPLLSAEQEYHCFRKLNYLKHQSSRLDRSAKLCGGCDQMLSDKKRCDEQSLRVRNQIVQSNLRLVVSLAKKYATYGSNEFDEFVGVGNASLLRAVDLFDYRRTTRFSTYAYRAIQCAIFGAYRKEQRVSSRFASFGNEATELAVSDAGESDFAELKAAEAREQVIHLMETLDERDRKIVMARFGINRKHSGVAFHVIAKEIGLSTTRTVQLFHRSLGKMRDLLSKRCSVSLPA